MYKQLVSIIFIAVFAASAMAQTGYWNMVNRNMMNSTTTAILIAGNCAKIKGEGRTLPEDTCCQYKRHGNSVSAWTTWDGSCGGSTSSSASKASAKPNANSKFTAVSNDDSLQKFADSIGTTEEEKQLMLQIAQQTKTAFEQQYAAKGWKDHMAGALTFFILSTSMVYNEQEPSDAAVDTLFKTFDQTMGSDAGLSSASNKDKTALYNSLIAYGGLPLTFYLHGKQTGNEAEVGKSKQLAAGFIKMILQTDPESLSGLLSMNSASAASGTTPIPERESPATSYGPIDARYSCLKLSIRNGISTYDPAGLGFTISGRRYSAVGGAGGSVIVNGGVVSFSGGRLNGYRGELRTNSTKRYIFFRVKFDEIRPNDSIRAGDLQCYKQ